MSFPHKEIPIKINNKEVSIDEELSKLIEEMNKVGLKTEACCQGKNEIVRAYVVIDPTNVEVQLKNNKIIIRWIRQVRPDGFTKKTKDILDCKCENCGKVFKDVEIIYDKSPCCRSEYVILI